jgi:hypothetical protein
MSPLLPTRSDRPWAALGPWFLLGVLFLCAAPLSAQADLTSVSSAAADAWRSHSFGVMVQGGRIQVTLPGVAPSTPVAPDQAEALLQSYVRGAVEVEVQVVNSSQVGADAAFVELARRYRQAGSQEIRSETILLAYRRRPLTPSPEGVTPASPPADPGGWVLTEVRAAGRG